MLAVTGIVRHGFFVIKLQSRSISLFVNFTMYGACPCTQFRLTVVGRIFLLPHKILHFHPNCVIILYIKHHNTEAYHVRKF